MRSAAPVLVLLVLVAVLAACGSSKPNQGPAAAQTATTQETLFEPFSNSGEVAVPVRRRATGECWTRSFNLIRDDTYRCASGNELFDTCFLGKHTTVDGAYELACMASPFEAATVLQVQRLPDASPIEPPSSQAWALRLVDGHRCAQLGGATGTVSGRRMNYFCGDDMYVFGEVDRSASPWTVFTRKGSAATLHRVGVAEVFS